MTSSRRASPRLASVAGWGIEVLGWTVVTWAVWLLSLSSVGEPDLLVGGLCALGCGVVAAGARRAIGARWRASGDAVRPALLLPISIVVDSAVVLVAPWLPRHRVVRTVRVDIGAKGTSATAAGRRAIATAVVSASPSSVVLDADEASGILTVHVLRSPGPALYKRYAIE